MLLAGGYNCKKTIDVLEAGKADLVAVARHYLANPDLLQRWRIDAPLNKYNRDKFYSQGNDGYLDYPFLDGVPQSALHFLDHKHQIKETGMAGKF